MVRTRSSALFRASLSDVAKPLSAKRTKRSTTNSPSTSSMIPLTDGVEVLRECCEFEDVSHLVDALVKVCVAAFHSCAAGVDTSLRIHQLN